VLTMPLYLVIHASSLTPFNEPACLPRIFVECTCVTT
jgi:hypothetical protein